MMASESSEHDKKRNGSAHDDDSKARTRVSRACTRCRARKDRCDGQRPTCSACRNAQATCCYEPATKKRGLPEGYVRGLEKLLALLIGKVNGFEDNVSHLMREHHSQLLKIWNHASVGEELHTTWKESKIIHDLEQLLSGLDQTTSVGQKRKRDREDDEDNLDAHVDTSFHTKPQFAILQTGETGQRLDGQVFPDGPGPKPPELPSNLIQLVDHYFAHTHCWFPIIDRPRLLRACYELSKGKLRENDGPTRALIWAILAYTSHHLQHSNRTNSIDDANLTAVKEDAYRDAAFTYIPNDPQLLTKTHAKACLILALLDIGLDKWKSAWTLVGRAVRVVLCDSSEGRATGSNEAAIFQGCAILDIAIASHLGVVSHIRRSEFSTRKLMDEDGYEEWEPWTAPGTDQTRQREPSFAASCFNRLTEIFLINADVLNLLSQPENLDQTYVQSLLEKLHRLQSTIPCPMPLSLQSPPHHIYLQLCHVSAQIRLVKLPIETGAGGLERAKLACNVLGLLELCKNANLVRLEHVPPFLVDCIESACKLARSSTSSFGSASGLPSYHEFNRTASELINTLAETWPVYKSMTNHQRSDSSTTSHADTPLQSGATFSPHPASSTPLAELPIPRSMHNSVEVPNRRSITSQSGQPDFTNRNASLSDLNTWQYPGPRSGRAMFNVADLHSMQFGTTNPLGQAVDPNVNPITNSSMGMNFPGVSPAATATVGITIPEPSPSFHGDEIDAIFHEMAHLETDEWSSERAVRLRDFDFSDDLTFQAFCNDSERLAASGEAFPPPLSANNNQTWTFARRQ